MKKTYGAVALLMAGMVILSLGVTALTGTYPKKVAEKRHITASFYPVYTAALQLTEGASGVTVSCLAQPSAGCLHDYQMTPSDRITLEKTDILLLNGAGAEGFLDRVMHSLPDMTVIDSSKGLSFLEEEENGTVGYNEHVWMSPARYAVQVQQLADGLCKADPQNAAVYRRNAAAYREKIAGVAQELKNLIGALGISNCVIFHESMAYLAEDLSLQVLGEVSIGEEETASAATLGALSEAIKGKRVFFLYDDQYDEQYAYLADSAAKAVVLDLNTAVRAKKDVADRDAWLSAMRQTINSLKEAAQ